MIMVIRIRFTQDLTKDNKYTCVKFVATTCQRKRYQRAIRLLQSLPKLAFVKMAILISQKRLIQFWP